jgi:hypothetical protein
LTEWKYQEDASLSLLTNEILATYKGEELNDAKAFQWKIIFTTNTLGHEEVAGRCSRIDGPIAYLWDNEFLIQVKKDEFEKATALDKTRILVHELHHIGKNENDQPAIRRHVGDFCEIPAHDKLSYKIAQEIYKHLSHLKDFTTQEEVVVTA